MNFNYETPLILSSKANNFEDFRKLISLGSEINHCDNKGRTCITYACINNNFEMFKYIIDCNYNLNSIYFESPIMTCCKCGNLKFLKYLIDDIKLKNYDIFCIKEAISNNYLDITKYLIDKRVNVKDTEYYNFINIACSLDNFDMVDLLIKNGCDVNSQDEFGKTSLHYSCENNNLNIVKLLINNKAIIKKDNYNITPLDISYSLCNFEIIDILEKVIS